LHGTAILCLALFAFLGLGIAGGPAAASTSPLVGEVDSVVVFKAERRLLLFSGGRVVRSYNVALGRLPRGKKTRQGDGRTPEGYYVLDRRNPDSRFYKSIHVSYPNSEDRARARRAGVHPGGDIMIHGLPNGRGAIGAAHRKWDWTEGCIAVTNGEMDEIWNAVADGTPIEIQP
jgi:murein L,D-transpeptidase YafK